MIRAINIFLVLMTVCSFAQTSDNETFNPFIEPTYPSNLSSSLLSELAEFFDPTIEEPKAKEDWDEMLKKLEKAKAPQLAKAGDLRFSRKKILNSKLTPFIFVLKHESTLKKADATYRVHYIKAKGKLNVSDTGYGTGATPVYTPITK